MVAAARAPPHRLCRSRGGPGLLAGAQQGSVAPSVLGQLGSQSSPRRPSSGHRPACSLCSCLCLQPLHRPACKQLPAACSLCCAAAAPFPPGQGQGQGRARGREEAPLPMGSLGQQPDFRNIVLKVYVPGGGRAAARVSRGVPNCGAHCRGFSPDLLRHREKHTVPLYRVCVLCTRMYKVCRLYVLVHMQTYVHIT